MLVFARSAERASLNVANTCSGEQGSPVLGCCRERSSAKGPQKRSSLIGSCITSIAISSSFCIRADYLARLAHVGPGFRRCNDLSKFVVGYAAQLQKRLPSSAVLWKLQLISRARPGIDRFNERLRGGQPLDSALCLHSFSALELTHPCALAASCSLFFIRHNRYRSRYPSSIGESITLSIACVSHP